jgi:AmiR/NasT family two-component response regulator
MEARRRIGQAQGILMARGDVTASQALAALRRIAVQRAVDVAEVAADVIADSRLGDLPGY